MGKWFALALLAQRAWNTSGGGPAALCLQSYPKDLVDEGILKAPALFSKLCVLCLVTQRVQLFAAPWTIAQQAPQSMGILQARILSGLPCLPLGDLPDPRIKPMPPASQADSLLAEPPGKPKNTGEGSLSLQQILLTQELNWGLLHCKWILYQLSYQGSP